MFSRIFIPEFLYQRWPYLCLAIAALGFAGGYNVVGALMFGYAVGIFVRRLSL